MSDHGHDTGHGSGGGNKGSGSEKSFVVDKIFGRVMDYIGEKIAKLVAFMLLIITIGAIFGFYVAQKSGNPLFLLIPACLGIVAYYERDIATLIFVGILLFVIL